MNNNLFNKFITGSDTLTQNKRNVYFIGLAFALAITLKEALPLSYNNFQILSFSSHDFWAGINPYSDWHHLSLRSKPLDNYLYGPLFAILFTPFALLPGWIGLFSWNIFTYSMFFLSVFTLPANFNYINKRFIFFYSALLLFATMLSTQFNPLVSAIFLFSFTLLEKDRGFWAILLILFSGFTKILGVFQLLMLLFYPKFWKNILFIILTGLFLLLLPAIKIPFAELPDYYHAWIIKAFEHSIATARFSIYRPLCTFIQPLEPYTGLISIVVFLLISVLSLLRLKLLRESFYHRSQLLGIIMSWTILFGQGSEKHTYVIAVVGYAIWYLSIKPVPSDKLLLWLNIIFLGILPIDILCPPVISSFLLAKLYLGIIIFTVTWIRMVHYTLIKTTINEV